MRKFNPFEGGEAPQSAIDRPEVSLMLTSILITLLITLSLAVALRSPKDELIVRRPYNNRHSDATAARESWLG